ncbi:hypothetical protein D9M68_936130 [compost metagenome]
MLSTRSRSRAISANSGCSSNRPEATMIGSSNSLTSSSASSNHTDSRRNTPSMKPMHQPRRSESSGSSPRSSSQGISGSSSLAS